jgi:spermidine synthase
MPLPFVELDFRPTPMGDLILRRRRIAMLDDLEVFEVKLGNAFLMSSLFHEVEEALADLGLAAVAGDSLNVVVGGLGLGYTAVAALMDERVAEVLVIDTMPAVIEWHRKGLVPLGATLTGDARCRFIEADFFALAADPDQGFDPAEPGRRFHAVLLDIDHSPDNLLHERHAAFYSADGLRCLAAQLLPGGVFALWSDDPPEAEFLRSLAEVFGSPKAHVVSFPNPFLDRNSESTVYVARKAAVS